MAEFKDCLLALTSYPDPTPDRVVNQAVDISRELGANLSALAFVLSRSRIARQHSMGEWLIDVPSMVDEAVHKSSNEATRLLDHFEKTAKASHVFQERLVESASIFPSADTLIGHARLRDLTFLPIGSSVPADELNTESVIFGSGRPAILLPAMLDQSSKAVSLDKIAVAWDFSRAAARALADAMPLLQKAKRVHVFTVVNEKPISVDQSANNLEQHLRMHGVEAIIENLDAGRRSIGQVIGDYVAANHVDMLVMGAFGHSRMREFILGGATRSILSQPPVPVLLSH